MMIKRRNFASITETVKNVNPYVLDLISERLQEGGRFVPQTPEEKLCSKVFDQIDYVGSFVNNSLASKKYQRNEVWSLINFKNTPAWFHLSHPVLGTSKVYVLCQSGYLGR
jgi:hypothetical protein